MKPSSSSSADPASSSSSSSEMKSRHADLLTPLSASTADVRTCVDSGSRRAAVGGDDVTSSLVARGRSEETQRDAT